MTQAHTPLALLCSAWLSLVACNGAPPTPPQPGPCERTLPCSLIQLQIDGVAARDGEAAMETVRCRVEHGLPIHTAFDSDIMDVDPVLALGIEPTSRVVDVGAGTGVLGLLLLERGVPFARYTAQDIDGASLDFLKHALELAKLDGGDKVEFVIGSRNSTSLQPRSADIAVLNSVRFAMRRFDEGQGSPPAQNVEGLVSSLVDAIEPGGSIHVIEPIADAGGKRYPEAWVREPFEHPRLELVEARIIHPRGAENYHLQYRVLEAGPDDERDESSPEVHHREGDARDPG